MKRRLLSILLAGVLVFSQAGGVLAAENTAAGSTSAEISETEEAGGEDSGSEEAEETEEDAYAADTADQGQNAADDGLSDAAEPSDEDDEDVTAPGDEQAAGESEEDAQDDIGEEAAGAEDTADEDIDEETAADGSEPEESGESSTAPAPAEEAVEDGRAADAANAQDEINGGFSVEIRDYDTGHRLFEDGVWSCPIEVRGPVALDYSLTMTVPDHNGPQDADVLSACRLEADEMRLYIDGGRLKEEGVTWFKLRVAAVLEGEETGEPCEREFTVDEPYIERQFGFGDRSLLPGWTQWIDRKHGCYVENGQYPYGEHFELTVTDVSVEDTEGEDVARIEYSDENGWDIRAKNGGVCKVTVSYDDWDGSSETEEFNLYVGSDVYEVDLWTDSGSDRILPGGETALTAEARHEVYDFASREHHSCSEEEMEGITYDWRLEFWDANAERDLGDLITLTQDPGNPANAVLRCAEIPDQWDHADVNIIVTISEDGEVKAENNHWIFMDRHYYELWPTRIDGNLDVGEKITFKPEIREYPADNAAGYTVLPSGQVKFETEIYDDQAYTITAGEAGTYELERLREYNTSFRIKAFIMNENGEFDEVDNREYWLNERDYHFWYEIEGNDNIFSDGSRTFGFNLDNLEGVEYELVPEVGLGEWHEGRGFDMPLREGYCWSYDSSSHRITLIGTDLYMRGADRVETRISLRIGGREVSSEQRGFDVREAWYDFRGKMNDEVLFVDDEWFLEAENDAFICTTDFPDGRDVRYEITNLTYEAEEDEFDTREPITLERLDDGWKVTAVRGGEALMHAEIEITASNGENDVTLQQEKDFRVIVGGRRIFMHLLTDTGSDRMQSGGTIRLAPQIYAEEYDWRTGERRDFDTSDYEVRYEVRCEHVAQELIEDRFDGDFEAAAARGVLWDYEVDPEDRSILLKSLDPESYEVEIEVEAQLIDPETGDDCAGADRRIFVDREIMELALRKADGATALEWDGTVPPGAEVEMVPVLMKKGTDGSYTPAGEYTDVTYRLEWHTGGGENDPAHLEITDKNGNALEPGQKVTSEAFPLTVKRMVDWDFNLSVCGMWTDDRGDEQEIWKELYCTGVRYSDGFNVNNDRGDKRFTWYYAGESIEVSPDRGKLDALVAEGYPVEIRCEIGVPLNGALEPIRNYEIDDEGRRGEEIGLYDLSGIFDAQSGLTVSGEALRDLHHMLRYQRDDWASGFARVQIVLSAQLNGVTLADELINVNIVDPFLEIVDVRQKMGVGTEQVFEKGQTQLYIEAPGHDSGINAYYKTGEFFDVTITNIEFENESDSSFLEITQDGEDWKLKALAQTDHDVPLTVTFAGGPEEYDTCRMSIQVTGDVFTAELRDPEGRKVDNVQILMNGSMELTPYVTHTEYREEDGELRETTSEVPRRGDAQGGFSYTISYDYFDDRVIDISGDSGVISPVRTGYSDVDVTVTIWDENGEWADEIWFPISVDVGVSRAELNVPEDAVFYVAPGEEFTAAQVGGKVSPALKVYSMKEPNGKEYPIDSYSLESVWFGDGELTLSDGGDGYFGKLSVSEDALAGVSGTKEVLLALRGREEHGNEAIAGVRVIIHNHNWTGWTQTKAPTVFAEGVSTGTCTVCGEKSTKPIAKLTPTIDVKWTKATIAKTKAKTAEVTFAAGDSVASVPSTNTKVATAKISGKNVIVTAGTTAGTAKITVKLKSCKTKVLTITVPNVNCTGITAKTSYTVTTLSTINMGVKLNPVYSDNTITYKSANTGIATVTKAGVVKGIKVGKTTVTITTSNKKTRKVTIVVKQGTTGLTTAKTAYTVVVGKTVSIGAKKTPAGSADAIKYTSANKAVATVTSTGVIKGIKAGKTTITVKSGTKSKVVTVTVKPKTTAITTLKTAYTVGVKKTVSLGAKKVPATSGEAITYTSSNTAVAKVSTAGVVTGVKKGKATITIKSGAVTKKVTVTVK